MGAILHSEKITERIYRIPVPLVGNPLKELNSYLILGNDRPLLIDTGFRMEECRQALFAALAEHGLKPGDPDVVLTHFHSDHAGLAPEVALDKTIYLNTNDLNLLRDNESTQLYRTTLTNQFRAEGFSEEHLAQMTTSHPGHAYAPTPGGNYHALTNGDVLDAGGCKLQSLFLPGHTPGQMCFWVEEEGILFTADHILYNITPNITSWIGVLDDSLGSYLDSLDKVSAYEVKTPLPGHRQPGDTAARIVELKDHHRSRLDETLRAVKENPGEGAYLLAGKLTWNIRRRSTDWEDFPLPQKWFAVGECIAHLNYLRFRNQIRLEMDNGHCRYFAV